MSSAPLVLSVAGFDPSGRAGLLADTWAIAQTGGAAIGVVTALTAQGPRFVCEPVAPGLIGQQLQAALASGKVRAAKLGMIPHRAALAAVVAAFGKTTCPIVIDPVVRTSKGEPLSRLTPGDYVQLGKRLGRRHRLVLTPNLAELAWLGVDPEALLRLGFWGIVVKGSQSAVDEVFTRAGREVLRGSRIARTSTHHRGTGCRFGSGLAVGLARGEDLNAAARGAKRLVRKYLQGPMIT